MKCAGKAASNQRITKVLDCPTTGLCALTRGHLAPLYAPRSTCLPDKLDCRYLLLSGTRRGFMDSRQLQAIGYVTVALESPRRGGIVHVKQKTEVGGVRVPVIPIKKEVCLPSCLGHSENNTHAPLNTNFYDML